jgi:glycosyltransferase involved in cell wall biosynthesis
MRLLYILHQFYPEFQGGTERVALALARCAQRAGHYVHVLACAVSAFPAQCGVEPLLANARRLVHAGVPVTLLERGQGPSFIDLGLDADENHVRGLEPWLEEMRFDAAHILHPMRMASAIQAVHRQGLPYALTLTDFFFLCPRINLTTHDSEHCPGIGRVDLCLAHCLGHPWSVEYLDRRRRQAEIILAGAGVRVCPSDYVARCFRQAFHDLDFRVIGHGVDLHAFSGPRLQREARENLVLGYIGTIVPEKGLQTLLEAFVGTSAAGLRLRITGPLHGPLDFQDRIKRLVASDSRIELQGAVLADQIPAVLQATDVLCLPSEVPESFSLILNEAAAVGVPALVTDLGAPAERVSEAFGRIVPARDIEAWGAVLRELRDNPGLVEAWRSRLPLPLALEEEGFYYDSFYRRLRIQARPAT